MQAIQSRYLPATNTKPSRIKAWCERGSLTLPYPHEYDTSAAHNFVARELLLKFVNEDAKRPTNPTPINHNPWAKPFSSGRLPNGDYAHVFIS